MAEMTINLDPVVISEYSTGSQDFTLTDGNVKIDITVYWTVKDNEVQWYAKCIQPYLRAAYSNTYKTYVFSGNNSEKMKLTIDNTSSALVDAAPSETWGTHARGEGWIPRNNEPNKPTYKGNVTETLHTAKKESAFSVVVTISGNNGASGTESITPTYNTVYSVEPSVTYKREGTNVMAKVDYITVKTSVEYSEPYAYSISINVGGQTDSVAITLTDGASGGTDWVSYTSTANTVNGIVTVTSTNNGKYSGSETFTMNVPAASNLSFAQTGISLGGSLPISITRYSGEYTDTIQYVINGTATDLVVKTDQLSYTWSPVPLSLASYATGSSTVTVTIRCTTYSGNTVIGQSDKTATFTIPDSIRPVITSLALSPVNENSTVAGWGIYLQGYSKCGIVLSVDVSGNYGATISNYFVSIAGTTVLDGASGSTTTNILTSAGTLTVVATVTDTRGHTATTTSSITVYPYATPTASNITCGRSNASGVFAPAGTYISAKATRVYSSANNHNSCTMTLSYKPTDGSYGTPVAMTDNTIVTTGNGNVSVSNTYVAKITVVDSLGGTSSYTIEIATGFATVNLKSGGRGVCFGGYATHDDSVEIAGGWSLITGSGIGGSALPLSGVDGQLFFEKSGHAVYPHIYGGGTFGTSKESFSPTYVSNALVTSSNFTPANTQGYRIGDMIYISLNLQFGSSTNNDFVSICTIPYTALIPVYCHVPIQGSASNLVMFALSGNSISAYKPDGASGNVRVTFAAPI